MDRYKTSNETHQTTGKNYEKNVTQRDHMYSCNVSKKLLALNFMFIKTGLFESFMVIDSIQRWHEYYVSKKDIYIYIYIYYIYSKFKYSFINI